MDAENLKQSGTFFLSGTVERFADKEAIIALENGQSINWPIANLPTDANIGSSIRISIHTAATEEEERQHLAKEILNEILSKNDGI